MPDPTSLVPLPTNITFSLFGKTVGHLIFVSIPFDLLKTVKTPQGEESLNIIHHESR